MRNFRSLLGGGSSNAVGFSIEADTIKYAEFQKAEGGRYRIGVWGVRRFSGAVEPPDAGRSAETAEATPDETVAGGPLMQPWTIGVLHKLKRYPVFASFADRDVLLKFISLPELNEQEVARMVELRHREYLPMPKAEIVYDFSMTRFIPQPRSSQEDEAADIPPAGTGRAGDIELRIMVTGMERGAYLAYRESFGEKGVILRSLETNQAALTRGCNFFLGPEHPGTYAVLYLNDTYSMVNFVVARGLYYSRLLEPGLQTLTPDEAGERRLDRLLRELYRSVDFFSVESRGIPVETLYLVNGGTTSDSGISHRIQGFLGERLAVKVQLLQEVAEQNDRLTMPAGILAGTLVIPIGLALRSSGEMGV